MNICYIQAFAKQVHTMLIKPIDTRESSLYFSEYLSCVSVAIFLQLHSTVNQPAQKGAGREEDHRDGGAARSTAKNPKKHPRKVSGVNAPEKNSQHSEVELK
ncbi:hypothetical protein ABVT39_019698 [Epinephelus coioides]